MKACLFKTNSNGLLAGLAAVAIFTAAGVANAQNAPPALVAPAAPDIKPGATVIDRDGQPVGKVQSMAQSPRGSMVVVDVGGKLVGVPEASLKPQEDGGAVSSQSKAEILGAARAP